MLSPTTTFSRVTIFMAMSAGLLLFACADTGVGDPCSLEVEPEGGYHENEHSIEFHSIQCRTRVCMVWNQKSFCTIECESDSDCNAEWYEDGPGQDEIPRAYCEAEIEHGPNQGSYCVPERASKEH